MLNPQLRITSDAITTTNVIVLLEQWDPRLAKSSQLQVDDEGSISVIANAMMRDKEKAAGSFFFESEKNIFISHLESIFELINKRKVAISAKEAQSVFEYYNQSNALQGLIILLDHYLIKYKDIVKFLGKAERAAKSKQSYRHLVSSDFQNLTIGACIGKLDHICVQLRELQQAVLTRNGQFDNDLDDALDHPVFMLGEGLEAYIPFTEPSISDFLQTHYNPLCVGVRIDATIGGRFRHLTLCPSWEDDKAPFIQGPSDYLLSYHEFSPTGSINFREVTLSVLMDFIEVDTTLDILPFVQTVIEIALKDNFRKVAIHAPNGCWPVLFALGFRTQDEAEPTREQQEQYVLHRDSTVFPLCYDINEPMIHIDSNDESFIHVTSLRLFHLDLGQLFDVPVFLDSRQTTNWKTLLELRRYLSPMTFQQIIPQFNYLPYALYTPSFKALCEREINGKMPANRVYYETSSPKASDLNNLSALQSIGSTSELLDVEELSHQMLRLYRK